ncbi:MOSC domain-containing protein [Leucothrix arctica]|uniref:MOSC domain-containing protein n=1 Tax=Leucothrix arctica TaxID=1481894 RepID=A0A317C7I9_9GAMM|nr:MOSC N-terminal beta barrel domain-containing protein [Leucothrix arctica]PWQ94211.1 hypothetical protein DKT75_16895 [Leucothrix arctica]
MITISKLITYPFKSAKGIELPHTGFDAEGLTNDRRLMAVDEEGTFMTARNSPELLQISCEPTLTGWLLAHPKAQSTLTISNHSTIELSGDVWSDPIHANNAGDEASEWISNVLNTKSHIAIWKPQARTSRKYSLETTFADAAPILITSEASMKQACDWGGVDNDYRRFRPNIIVSGVEAFEEENWTRFTIGDATYEMLDTCSRCVLVTRDPDTGERHPKLEPMLSLIKKHSNAKKEPIMGINVKLISSPESVTITVNDRISLI